VALSEIYREIRRRVRENPRLVVVLNCDKSQQVDRLIQVMDEVKRANAENVLIATEPKAREGGGTVE
jgi:biopolymer transport protein ExbD